MHNKIKTNKKNIIILGAGFCGIQTAKRLAKKMAGNQEYQIILVDRHASHTYSGDLYEISTAYNKEMSKACLTRLEETVCIHMNRVFKGMEVMFLRDSVIGIDSKNKTVSFKNHETLNYEYLVLALGSVTNYYNIPGLEEHAFPLKTVEDAMALNCHVDQFFAERHEQKNNQKVHIVVGGGGFTGAEYACELAGCIKKLSNKYKFDESLVEISIVQGSAEFVGLGQKVSDIAVARFKKLHIKPVTGVRIAAYDGKMITLNAADNSQKQIPADILVWTGGIKPNPILNSFDVLDKSGAIEVYPNLECTHYPKVYAGGDNAAIFDASRHGFLPKLAQLAIQQGRTIADNIHADITGHEQKVYKPFFKGFIVPLGGTYFVYSKGSVIMTGLIPYLMRKYVDFVYFAQLMPLKLAIKKWFTTENIFLQNDAE